MQEGDKLQNHKPFYQYVVNYLSIVLNNIYSKISIGRSDVKMHTGNLKLSVRSVNRQSTTGL